MNEQHDPPDFAQGIVDRDKLKPRISGSQFCALCIRDTSVIPVEHLYVNDDSFFLFISVTQAFLFIAVIFLQQLWILSR